jgi:hypothetical protein
MDPKSKTSWIAIFISIISLVISANTSWVSYFKPAEIICTFPHMTIWTRSNYIGDKPTGEIASRHITPSLWIGNSGAKNILIEDIRLVFIVDKGENFNAYPTNKIPYEAIEYPNTFNNYELLNLGGPFLGFSLSRSEGWKSMYSFSMKEEYYHKLKGEFLVEVQIFNGENREWRSIHKEAFDFGSHPFHLQGLINGQLVTGILINPVYSSNWEKRRQNNHE